MSETIRRRTAILGALGALGALSAPAQTGKKRRNILFILSDDHRYDALGFMQVQKKL